MGTRHGMRHTPACAFSRKRYHPFVLDDSCAMTDPTAPPQPPLPPSDGMCCDSGCDPCVWDFYAEELARYREERAIWQAAHPEAPPLPDR